jgi:hypothetical protein
MKHNYREYHQHCVAGNVSAERSDDFNREVNLKGDVENLEANPREEAFVAFPGDSDEEKDRH